MSVIYQLIDILLQLSSWSTHQWERRNRIKLYFFLREENIQKFLSGKWGPSLLRFLWSSFWPLISLWWFTSVSTNSEKPTTPLQLICLLSSAKVTFQPRNLPIWWKDLPTPTMNYGFKKQILSRVGLKTIQES